jgi:hypothetical protein
LHLLDAARGVSARVLDRLVELHADFPADLPGEAIRQLSFLSADVACERRGGLRLSGGLPVVTVLVTWPRDDQLNGTPIPVHDRAPAGLALVLPRPALVGTVLEVQGAGMDDRFRVQVKHCYRERDGWVAGCEFVGRASA